MVDNTTIENASFTDFNKIGVEVEWPAASRRRSTPTMNQIAGYSKELFDEVQRMYRPENSHSRTFDWPLGGKVYEDCTVGLEIPSDVQTPSEIGHWYVDTLDLVEDEFRVPHEPCGKLERSTAGMHVHMSDLSEADAKLIQELSAQRWFQSFVCTSVAYSYKQVYRGGGTSLPDPHEPHDGRGCIHQVGRGSQHYEWRLPEPMTREHFQLFADFLTMLSQGDVRDAINYTRDLVNEADSRVTSFARAEAVGVNEFTQPVGQPTGLDEWFANKVQQSMA